jgi:transcription initiation factor TFIIB
MDMMKIKMDSTKPDDFVGRFCSKLNMTNEMKDVCRIIVKRANELGLVSENTPPAVAAGTLYMCSVSLNWGFSKKEVSDACEISQVTISKCFKKLQPFERVLLPKAE